ncbi:MAG: tetratricopeptide repeat protein [Pyrinomonadaceae bacterium]
MFLSILRTVATITIATLLFAGSTFAQQNTRELFERARMLDESNQNLSEAIKLYGQVVSQANEQRALAARAQYRIGVLYERLGRKAEAQRAFQAVANQYADQTDLAQRARAKLPAAAKVNPSAKTKTAINESTAMTVRQVWAGGMVDIFGVPSADGRYLPVTDWETGDLGIRDLENGQTRRLTNKGSWMQSTEFALFPMLSPDGKQIAYDWFNKDYAWDFRIMATDGSTPRVLYKGSVSEDDFVVPAGWRPDGKHLAVFITKVGGKGELALISATDGSVRVLKTFSRSDGGHNPGLPRLSPDGRYIVTDRLRNANSKQSDLELFDIETKQMIPLVQHPSNNSAPIWTPDGKNILFVSDRTGTLGFWLQSVVDGKPKGAPQLIKSDLGIIWPMGFTRNGSLYYGLDTGMNDVYLASLDFKSGKVLQPPAPLSLRYVGSNSAPAWSPDGKYLAYVSQRGPGGAGGATRDKVVVIRSLATSQERDLAVSLSVISRPQWSPDGQSIFVGGQDRQGRSGIYRIDAQTGAAAIIVQEEGNNYRWPTVSPDGKTLFYLQINFPNKRWTIRARDLQGGEEKELYSVSPPTHAILSMGLSPDGQQLAFVDGDATKPQVVRAIKVMPANGGEARDIYQFTAEFGGNSRLIWTPDGQRILFVLRQDPARPDKPSDQTFELWQVSAAGGEPQRLGLPSERLRDLALHPDGKRLAFAAGQTKNEVWVMKNFLPLTQPRKTSVSRR